MKFGRRGTVVALGTAQTLAWASSYYLPAILAAPMAADLGIPTSAVFAAFSAALVVSAVIGPAAGRAIDRWGGRPVLVGTNLIFATSLAMMGAAQGTAMMLAAWLLMGVGMASGLYEAAFAALVRLYGRDARGAITGITLFAGFASTVGWPLSTLLDAQVGWRGACYTWAALHLVIGLPLNALVPRAEAQACAPIAATPAASGGTRRDSWRGAVALSFVFAVTWFISTAMAAHLPGLLRAAGATLATAVLVGSLIGPSQVAARALEFSVLRNVHPLLSARIAAMLHPAGAAALALVGPPAALVFGVLHGAGNGILTIAKGTLPLAVFGPHGYGHRQGLLMVPARFAQALAPWAFGLALDRWGTGALWVSGVLGLSAVAVLFVIEATPTAQKDVGAVG